MRLDIAGVASLGWVTLGSSALRLDRPAAPATGAAA
jgi:hypothetical protein